MAKMKKALGSLALIIALAMIVGMLPTVVLASNTTAITTQADACYDEEDGIVTVEGTISSNEAEVTILAVRTAEEIEEAATLSEMALDENFEDKIVYIDQVGAEDEDNYVATENGANWNFTFIPKEGVPGGWITVFVGGTDADISLVSFSAQIPAPTLEARTWYKGEDLVMDITYAGGADAIATWAGKINAVLVNGEGFDAYDVDEDAATITFTGLDEAEAVTSITITTVDGEYAAIEMTELNITAQNKNAGTLTPVSATVIEGVGAVEFTVTESAQDGWLAEFGPEGTAVVKVNGDEYGDWSFEGSTLTVNGLTVGNEAYEAAFSVVVETPNYEASEAATVTLEAPTNAAKDAFSNANVVSGYKDPADLANSDYGVIATTPAEGLYDCSVSWSLQILNGDNWEHVAELTSGEEYLVGRTSDSYLGGQYKVVAAITSGDFKAQTWEKTFSVTAFGVAGVDVQITTTFINADAAATAEVSFDDGAVTFTNEAGTQNFTASAVTVGTHELTISRAGYSTLVMNVTVNDDGSIVETIPTMFVGDISGDGTVDRRDLNPMVATWMLNSGVDDDFNASADLNGDNTIDRRDLNPLVANWMLTKGY